MLGRSLSPTRGKDSAVIGLRWSIIYSLVGLLVFFGASAFAAEVATDAPNYLIGTTVDIDGSAFGPDEFVTVQVTELDGTPIAGASGMPWSVSSDALGGFVTTWLVDYQGTSSELLLTATGQESGATASTTFVAGSTNLDQLQNGTTTTAPKWANGNINSSNSCYSEGRVVPYRAFITADTGSHFFTIEMEWTKANVHAFDYLGSYDFSEDSAITLAGGPCGDSGTTAPADCVAPTDSLVFPDPDTVSNYSGSIPGDFYPSTYEYNDTHYLMAYNAIIDSVGKYYFGGTASDRTWSVEVYYTQVDTGTVGFYWGGNLSQGDTTHWGVGNGSASVAGAPYHMRMKDFDGGGGANQDRSIQNGTICLPPEGEIVIDADSLCNDLDSTYTASDTSGGGAWLWSVTNGTIVGDSTLSSVDFTVDPGATSVTVHLNVCNTTGGCPGDFCCADLEVTLPTKSCCIPPVVSCPSDDTLFVCDLSPICVDGFTSSDDDGDLANCTVSLGTLNGTEVCFTPVEGANTITYICTDSCDLADTCETTIYVVLNSAPNTPTCPAGVDLVLCDLTDSICVDGFSCNGDPDGNFDYSYATGGVLNGGTVCLLPVEGANVITYICVDSCGDSSYCQTTVNVTLDTTGPEVTCPANISVVQCDLTDICIDGFSSVGSVSCSVDLGTLTGSQVCFTPVEGDNVITYTCVDSCGNESSCQTTVNVTLDTTGPEVTCPANVSVVQCDLTDICIDGFSSVGSASCSVDLGTLTGSQVCFTPVEGDNVITYTCVDSCGNESSCQTTVNVTLDTTGPEVTCPANVSVVQCDLTDICIDGFSSVGSASCSVDLGTLTGTEVCFTPVEGDNVITYTCVDSCGNESSCQTTVNVTLDTTGPEVTCPANVSVVQCDLTDICIDGFSSVGSASCSVDLGTLTGTEVCFTPVEGDNVITYTCVDSCGNESSCQTTVNVTLDTTGPEVTCPANVTLDLCDITEVCIDGFSSVGSASCSVDIGTLTGSEVCFIPIEGDNVITYTCVDSCGNPSSCQTTVTVNLIPGLAPPSCPPSQTVQVCDLSQLCIDGFIASSGSVSCSVDLGTLTGSEVCFTPVEGDNVITFTCVDSCGVEASCQTTVTVDIIPDLEPPSCPPVDTILVCDLSELCIDGFFGSSGAVSCWATPGTLTGTTVCFTPVEGDNVITVGCVDVCGRTDSCQTTIHVILNSPPNEPTCPNEQTLFVCDLSQICIPGFECCTDPDGNLESCEVTGGTLTGSTVCFDPVEGYNTITVTCTDSCGATSSCTRRFNVVLNAPPVVTCPGDTSIIRCIVGDTVCVGAFSATDPDGNLSSTLLNGQPYTPGGQYCLEPDSGANLLIFTAIDSCGASATCTTIVDVEALPAEDCDLCPSITIEKTHNAIQGSHEYVAVTVDSSEIPMGGYDILIAYDASALNLQTVIPGPPFYDPAPDGCGWEYFVYRYGPCGACAGGCPSGQVRVFGLAETNNGPNHPDCFLPASLPATLFTLDFLVTNDRTFECQYIPVRFFWCDCGDNTVSSVNGNILYMAEHVYEFEGTEITDSTFGFPTYFGPQEGCLDPEPGKPTPHTCLTFTNGGVDIVCADSIDARGDINLNGNANEIADAVLLSNYFIQGLPVFNVNVDGQIAASDVNADGITLSVADLVYLIRIIVGDALPYFKQAPIVVGTDLAGGVLSVNASLGAAWLVVEGEQQPHLLASNMEMKYGYDAEADLTRILVFSLQKDQTFEGAFVAGLEGELVKFEAATYEGIPVTAKLVPDQFALYPSYPNPFNPVATIAFALAEAADYELTIYNALGREVKTFKGHSRPGVVEVQWNANGHASGIYLYRLKAGTFSETRKMVLLK